MTDQREDLPALPEARESDERGLGWFTAGQMLAYGEQCRAFGRAESGAAAADVQACVIGDYGIPAARRWATVLLDDRKVAECYTNEDAELIARALRALPAAVPDHMVLVPREPTPKMQQVALEASREGPIDIALPRGYELAASALTYRAMIAAAQPALETEKLR